MPPWMGKESQRCLWSRPVVGRGWHLLSQARESWSEGLSPACCPLREGWEGSQRSFPLTQQPFSSQRSSPGGLEHLHVALACLSTNLHATRHSLGFVLRQERDTCDPDNGLGCSHLIQLRLPQVSNVFSSAPAHAAPTHPSLENGDLENGAETHHRLKPGLAHALATRRRDASFFSLLW